MKKEFSLEEKMSAIGIVFQGESARSVSRRLHLGHHTLYEWIESYKLHGVEGLKLKPKKKKRLSYEESELTLFQLSAKYQLSSSIIGNWVKLVERNGFEALAPRKLGRPKTGRDMTKQRPKEEYEKENERLRKENERLRLENLLLKKVKALVEEREARNRAIGRKPSKN